MNTLQSFLRELTFIKIPDIKRHAKGLLIALEKSNRKEMLEYKMIPRFDRQGEVEGHNCEQNAYCEICGLKI